MEYTEVEMRRLLGGRGHSPAAIDALLDYIMEGKKLPPELEAIAMNNLRQTHDLNPVFTLDGLALIKHVATWFHCYTPADCHGAEWRVGNWVDGGGQAGVEARKEKKGE